MHHILLLVNRLLRGRRGQRLCHKVTVVKSRLAPIGSSGCLSRLQYTRLRRPELETVEAHSFTFLNHLLEYA